MKWISFLVLACACAPAQEFYTGQAARLVIGQKPFTAQALLAVVERVAA